MPDSYALFGYPVHHSWSPFIHGMFARQTDEDMVYRLQESPPERSTWLPGYPWPPLLAELAFVLLRFAGFCCCIQAFDLPLAGDASLYVEVAPGIDVERDILPHMDLAPIDGEYGVMDARTFNANPMTMAAGARPL